MAFCTNCGTKLEEGAVFCGNCGAKVAAAAASVTAPKPTMAQQGGSPQRGQQVRPQQAGNDYSQPGQYPQGGQPPQGGPQGGFGYAQGVPQARPQQAGNGYGQLGQYPQGTPGQQGYQQPMNGYGQPAQPPYGAPTAPVPPAYGGQPYGQPGQAYPPPGGGAFVPDVGFKENFLKFNGRLNRKRFILRGLAVALAATVVGGVITAALGARTLMKYPYLPALFISLPCLPFSYSLCVRRLQDLNKDNKLAIAALAIGVIGTVGAKALGALGSLLSLVSFGISVYLTFVDGTHGPNQYGPDPLNRLPKV